MELDFRAIRALSSPTRIAILSELMHGSSTPTRLSGSVEKSKSTVVSHLEVLQDAGLVEKDKEEGRKRVEYAPTSKASSIVEGKERKVQFSLASSGALGLAALVAGGLGLQKFFTASAASADSGEMQALTAQDTARESAAASSGVLESLAIGPEILLFTSITLLSISVGTFVFGTLLNRLKGD